MSKKRSRKGPGTGTVVMLLAIGALGLGALATYVKATPADRVPETLRRHEPPKGQILDRKGDRDVGVAPSRRGTPEKVLVPTLQAGNSVKLVASESTVEDPKIWAVDKTLEAFKLDAGRVEHLNVAGGVAKIDFNQAVVDGMGSMEGGTFLKALQMVMGQFKDVELLQFTVNGQPIESLDGHIEVIDPVPVIRPDATQSEGQNRP